MDLCKKNLLNADEIQAACGEGCGFWVNMRCESASLQRKYLHIGAIVFKIARLQNLFFIQEIFNMANSAQARKRARQSVKQRAHNASLRTAFRTAIKKVLKAVEAGDKAAAQATYRESVKVIDRIADKGIFHKNKAARHKSRLSAKVKALA